MIMDGSAMLLLYDDIEKAYRGEPMGRDTYCSYLGCTERERETDAYLKSREAWIHRLEDESWRVGFAPDRNDRASEAVFLPCRRVITKAEITALSRKLGMSENLLCVGMSFLTLTKLEGEGQFLCDTVYHNRSDRMRQNAFGFLLTTPIVALRTRNDSSVAGFYADLRASWIESITTLLAAQDALQMTPRGMEILQICFNPSEVMGGGALSALGAQSEEMPPFMAADLLNQGIAFYEQPGFIVPTLIVNPAHYSPAKQAAILDALAAVIDRLIAMEDPKTTTVGELLE